MHTVLYYNRFISHSMYPQRIPNSHVYDKAEVLLPSLPGSCFWLKVYLMSNPYITCRALVLDFQTARFAAHASLKFWSCSGSIDLKPPQLQTNRKPHESTLQATQVPSEKRIGVRNYEVTLITFRSRKFYAFSGKVSTDDVVRRLKLLVLWAWICLDWQGAGMSQFPSPISLWGQNRVTDLLQRSAGILGSLHENYLSVWYTHKNHWKPMISLWEHLHFTELKPLPSQLRLQELRTRPDFYGVDPEMRLSDILGQCQVNVGKKHKQSWGPFWVATTAVLFLAATGNFARLDAYPWVSMVFLDKHREYHVRPVS